MSMERLWAGWRAEYINGLSRETPGECLMCALAGTSDDKGDYVVFRGDGVFVALNAYPYTSGQLMVSPNRHVGEIEDLSPDESAALWEAIQKSTVAIKDAYEPHGFNVGINIGRAAGAGVPDHIHVHVVPRWDGDTNFMTATAEVRVLPESLGTTAERLRAVWPK